MFLILLSFVASLFVCFSCSSLPALLPAVSFVLLLCLFVWPRPLGDWPPPLFAFVFLSFFLFVFSLFLCFCLEGIPLGSPAVCLFVCLFVLVVCRLFCVLLVFVCLFVCLFACLSGRQGPLGFLFVCLFVCLQVVIAFQSTHSIFTSHKILGL